MYKIFYDDGTTFKGGNPEKSLWSEAEDKPIQQLVYVLGKNQLIMKGYERYNHLVEHEVVVGKGDQIVGLILMGEIGQRIEKIRVNFKENKLEKSYAKLGQEHRGAMTTGWKKGVKGKEAGWQII